MTKTTTICDSCNKEYTKGQYGTEGVLELKITNTNSCSERSISKMDLCGTCISRFADFIEESTGKKIKYKSEGLGVYY